MRLKAKVLLAFPSGHFQRRGEKAAIRKKRHDQLYKWG